LSNANIACVVNLGEKGKEYGALFETRRKEGALKTLS